MSKQASKQASKQMPNRVWHVTLVVDHEGKRAAWTCRDVSAPTIKRAVREARGMRRTLGKPGTVVAVAGVQDRDLASLQAEVL